ncbi:hypothetical protein C3L33_15682, partial [Rhododendron williamsianum]
MAVPMIPETKVPLEKSMIVSIILFLLAMCSLQVETIMDKENFTLEELLDEDEIIQECKALNSRLINLYDLSNLAYLSLAFIFTRMYLRLF